MRKGKEGSRFGEEESQRKEEEEEEDSSGEKGGKAMDGSAAFNEGVRVRGDKDLVGDGDEEADKNEVELQVLKARMMISGIVGGGGRRNEERREGT